MALDQLKKRKISLKAKGLVKPKELKVIESNGSIIIEIIPYYQKELTDDEINNVYLSFLELGKQLYNDNKDKINKIKFNSYGIKPSLDYRYVLMNDPKEYADDKIINYVKNWVKKHNIDNILNNGINNNFFLKTTDNFKIDKLVDWIHNNFADIETDASDDEPWVYVNIERMIDLSIFVYLVTYAVNNWKSPSKHIDEIEFRDFIDFEENKDLSNEFYICLINDLIAFFEELNMNYLYGYNKLRYIREESRFEVTREYNSIYGVIWYVFKLYLVDNFSYLDANDKTFPIRICKDCGNPFIGTKLRCDECDYNNSALRKAKSRSKMLKNVEEIQSIINNYNIPKNLLDNANKYVSMTRTQLFNSKKKEIDNTLLQLKNYINKGDVRK